MNPVWPCQSFHWYALSPCSARTLLPFTHPSFVPSLLSYLLSCSFWISQIVILFRFYSLLTCCFYIFSLFNQWLTPWLIRVDLRLALPPFPRQHNVLAAVWLRPCSLTLNAVFITHFCSAYTEAGMYKVLSPCRFRVDIFLPNRPLFKIMKYPSLSLVMFQPHEALPLQSIQI